MTNNYLITGYWGEPHVTAENDRGIHAAAFGKGRFVLPVGEQFRAEYIGNNTIRMYDGKLMDNGAAAGIAANEYIDFLISNAGQSMARNDLIVFQYHKDPSTLVEKGTFIVLQGEETTGTPSDPELAEEDLLSDDASFDQMALWRVRVSGTSIGTPVRVSPVKWQNPPMENNVEYLTCEQWLGKPVYTKLVEYTLAADIGNASGTFGFAIEFSTPNFHQLIRYCGTIDSESGDVIPGFNTETGGGYIGVNYMNSGGVALAMNKKTITAGTKLSVQVWYTKTTD